MVRSSDLRVNSSGSGCAGVSGGMLYRLQQSFTMCNCENEIKREASTGRKEQKLSDVVGSSC